MDYTGERAMPWNPATGAVMDHHAMRYAWALQFCHDKAVADLGCGAGYGSFMMSWVARSVVGVDVSVLAVAYARGHFQAPNLRYRTGDITTETPEAGMHVAFEVLEHLDDPLQLAESIEGMLLWSVPTYDNSKYHRHVYTPGNAERFGGDIWYQSGAGYIVPKESARFQPRYVLGARE